MKKLGTSIVLLGCALGAHAQLFLDFVETTSQVQITVSGSLNTDALGTPFIAPLTVPPIAIPASNAVIMVPGVGNMRFYTLAPGTLLSYGNAMGTFGGTYTGPDRFLISRDGPTSELIAVSDTYVSGAAINASLTINSSFAGMGITNFATRSTNLSGNQTLTYRFTPVPEPATMAALGLGLAAFMRRRSRVG